jgi:uncharacterized protein
LAELIQKWVMTMSALLIAVLVAAQTPDRAALDAVPKTRLEADQRCLLGAYSLPKKGSITITGDNGQARGLRYTLADGQFGKLQELGNGSYNAGRFTVKFEPCAARAFQLTKDGVAQRGIRLRLSETATRFSSDGIMLNGKLVLPEGGKAIAAAVWIEGSNNNPSTDDSIWQYELARRGVAVFVYDKRGTGSSAGQMTSDFYARARDTAAAVREVRRLAPQIKKVGVIGGSQGGWVAPLTATMVELDFVIPAFAMAESPIAQDKAVVELQLRQAGYSDDVLAEARELTNITERIVRSNFRESIADLDSFKTKHKGAQWLKAVQPRSYTGLFLSFPSEQIAAAGPAMAQGLTFDFDPKPIIETIQPRQLWLLGGRDQQAPSDGTRAILEKMQKTRSDISVIVFPNADHGLIERRKTPDGEVLSLSEGLFDIVTDWIKRGATRSR